MSEERLRAVIYVPAGRDADRWQRRCMHHVQRRGYELVAIVADEGDGAQWASVRALIDAGDVEIVVVAKEDHLPPDRLPRPEVAEEGPAPTPSQRRPRLIRRRDEGASR